MLEHNRLRLSRLTARYATRLREGEAVDEAAFLAAFEEVCAVVVGPVFEECAAALRLAGHAARVARDEGSATPCIELVLGLKRARAIRNVVGFAVARWEGYPLQILAYLEVNPPKFDLERFASADEIKADRVEQMAVDAIEHVISCNAP
jgi:hypothetical protein